MESLPLSTVTIDCDAIAANLAQLRRLAPATRLLCMVKADGYGMGALPLTSLLARLGVDLFGVAYLEEALALRTRGITAPLFVLHAPPVEELFQASCEVAVSDLAALEAFGLLAGRLQCPLKVHLHMDSGMRRLGCRIEEVPLLVHAIVSHPWLSFEGFMTHLVAAEDPSQDDFTERQIASFAEALAFLQAANLAPRYAHIANSAGLLRHPSAHFSMARIGLALFGLQTVEDQELTKNALTLTSSLLAIHRCRTGESVGYGRRYVATRRDERIGVIPLGYFDGIHRHYLGARVSIRGAWAPIVAICMDFLMVDLTEIPEAERGDTVVLFGEGGLSPFRFAKEGGTHVHELISCLGPRIRRLFVGSVLEGHSEHAGVERSALPGCALAP